jgi:hypothetical protein
MTLRKKNSRTIKVGEAEYRWTISPGKTQIIFVAESNETKGRKLEVIVDSDIDRFWVEFPNVQDLNLKVMNPRDAAKIISQALALGWNPTEKGTPLRFEFKNEKLAAVNT